MSCVESRRDLFEQICEVPMNVTAEQLVNIETFAIKVKEQRGAFFTSGLQIDVDEKWTAGKLLHDQIACCFTGRDLLTSRDVFDELRRFGLLELFETQNVESLEVTFRIVSGFEDLAT